MGKNKVEIGQFLIAEPYMRDTSFKRSVILLCEHNDEGSVGFVINKPLNMPVQDLMSDFPDFSGEAYFGGPVSQDTIHYVHTVGDILDDSVEIVNGLFWGGDFKKLKFLIEQDLIKENQVRFFVGYAGWTKGQLEDELAYGSWIIGDMDTNFVFSNDYSKLWTRVMKEKGNTFEVIAQIPQDNILN